MQELTMDLAEIESLPILDKETAIRDLGDVELFETMLMGFEEMTMRKNLTELKFAIEDLNYKAIRLNSHSLKGASSYLHAERVKTAAAQLQFTIDSQTPEEIFKKYPVLIKQCIILKRKIRLEGCLKESKIQAHRFRSTFQRRRFGLHRSYSEILQTHQKIRTRLRYRTSQTSRETSARPQV